MHIEEVPGTLPNLFHISASVLRASLGKLPTFYLCNLKWQEIRVWNNHQKSLRNLLEVKYGGRHGEPWIFLSMFKGTVPRDFSTSSFFMNNFTSSSEYLIRAVSNIFQKIWGDICSVQVHHRWHWHQWQMEKIFNQRSFKYFVCTPLGSRVNI